MLKDRTLTLFPNDEDGPRAARLAWRLPDVVTPEMKAEARSVIGAVTVELRPANPTTIRKWVAALGSQTSGTADPSAIQVRAGTLCRLIGHLPARCFTDQTLEEALRKFDFFPSFKALVDLLEPKASYLAELRRRLTLIIEARPPSPRLAAPSLTDEQRADNRARTEAILADLRSNAAQSKRDRLALIESGNRPTQLRDGPEAERVES